jgi:tRNA A37 N6-isopentenylltransferase MiaA
VEEAIERDASRTWQFARRQRTWFRREPGIEWIDMPGPAVKTALALIEPVLNG